MLLRQLNKTQNTSYFLFVYFFIQIICISHRESRNWDVLEAINILIYMVGKRAFQSWLVYSSLLLKPSLFCVHFYLNATYVNYIDISVQLKLSQQLFHIVPELSSRQYKCDRKCQWGQCELEYHNCKMNSTIIDCNHIIQYAEAIWQYRDTIK